PAPPSRSRARALPARRRGASRAGRGAGPALRAELGEPADGRHDRRRRRVGRRRLDRLGRRTCERHRPRRPPVRRVRAHRHRGAPVGAGPRGGHTFRGRATGMRGPLGLAAWYRRGGGPAEVLVYPDLPAAWRLVLAVRQGRFTDPGRLTRGPLGLGTDFESIRDYLPDDDIRQVNWRATARLGRPMSNQYRVEQDRDVVCMLAAGRLMATPLGD